MYKPTRDEVRTLMDLKAGTTEEVDDKITGEVKLVRVPEEPIPQCVVDALNRFEKMVRRRSATSGMSTHLLTAIIVLALAAEKGAPDPLGELLGGAAPPTEKPAKKNDTAPVHEGDTVEVTVKGKAQSGTFVGREGDNLVVSIDGKMKKVPAADVKGVLVNG